MIPISRLHDATANRNERVTRRNWQGNAKPVVTIKRKAASKIFAIAFVVLTVSAFVAGAMLEAMI